MKRNIPLILLLVLMMIAFTACGRNKVLPATDAGNNSGISILPAGDTNANTDISTDIAPDGVQARPGSGATHDPSGNLVDLVESSGTVKEVKEGLVLITTKDGGEFMLRFSENSTWDEGVNQEIKVGNQINCLVKLEPTFTTPSQGEVFEVISNTCADE